MLFLRTSQQRPTITSIRLHLVPSKSCFIHQSSCCSAVLQTRHRKIYNKAITVHCGVHFCSQPSRSKYRSQQASTTLTRLLANVQSCSRHGVVTARLTLERPGGTVPFPKVCLLAFLSNNNQAILSLL